ncbi:PREDICTED: putative disease resistance RPP13-like protein 1 [Theobroma cacao]|uniref:Disease resistance RPP13-like protein 1 n=1 Tax=Theobroma cacao TaxID=3641 RepID=A0AB32WE28_THECC|nr:PREDICTED: putative disease resistance RPP13-like protein 1 [Theobroma cacao]
MEALAAIGEAFFTSMFEALLDKFNASDLIYFAQKEKLYVDLKKLEKKLLIINAVLTDAGEKQVTDRTVKIWLTELRDSAYDVEDVLDEFAYEALRRRLTAQPRTSIRTVRCWHNPPSLSCFKWGAGTFRVKMRSKIKGIDARLQEIATQKSDLELRENVEGRAYKARDQRLPTTCLVNEVNVYGREKDTEAIVERLLVETTSDAEVPVIPIVGMGGIGKTTLAQLVYNDDKVAGFFDSKAWIYVSEDFDVIKVMKAVSQSVNGGVPDTNDLNLLHIKLKEELSEKKILLVLDDVWHDNYVDWTSLIRPLEFAKSGSKIIITTRNQNVAKMTGTLPAYQLKELAYDDCLSVLARHALGRENFDGHTHLKDIGEEIVKKCKGLTLAVKTLAGLLRNKVTYEEWEAVSKSKMWDLTEEKGGIFSALRLSYHHLPSHLKPCFAYCSLFPKDHEFDRDELVLLWIAAGFVQQKGDKQPEDIGREYFSDLLSRSFFQQSNNNKSLFLMHDLIIDLAQSVAGDLCFNMEHEVQIDDGQHSFEKARHVSFIRHQYDVSQRFEIFSKRKDVRSFLALPLLHQREYCYLSSKVSHQLLPKLKRLRVLSLSGYFIGDLLNSIGYLKHLRYLNLSRSAIRLLPESVGYLHHLQILILNHCRELTALPVGTSRLIKLHRLDISDTPKLQEMPSGLGNLNSLRVLPKFIIGKAGGLTLRDLKNLSLQGQLSIQRLQNVVDIQDARVANLKHKLDLKELALEWSNDLNLSRNGPNQLQILESLCPPKDLQRLSISNYGAGEFPYWVGNPSFAKIEHLDLSDCINCTSLPSLGRLPLLRKLNIKGMHAVTSLDPEFYGEGFPFVKAFPSLEFLRFENMKEWKKWISSVGNVELFPLLRELILHNCPKLTGNLPRNLCSLVKLDVQMCPVLTNSPLSFPCLGELNVADSSDAILKSMVNHSSITKLKLERISGLACLTEELTKALVKLEVLEIEGCNELTCFWWNGSESENLPRLKSLVLKNCPELVSLVGEKQGLCRFSSLKDLRIEGCQKFVCFPEMGLPYTLKCLTIHDCEALESLPDTFRMKDCNNPFCLLEELQIVGCPSLKSVPNGKLPLTLKRLSIVNCNNLQFLPDDNWNSASLLEYLCIKDCLALESFLESGLSIPNLKILHISNCSNLRSLPKQMQNVTSLRKLSLSDCMALESIPPGSLPPNITSLKLRNCINLKKPMSVWGLDKLNCLTKIKIAGTCPAADMVSFPDKEGVMLPSTLTDLRMESLQNLESLSRALESLTALEQLHIKDCRKLRYLPKTGLPASLGRLCISGCLVLQDKCKKDRGEYWPMISNIPCLEID